MKLDGGPLTEQLNVVTADHDYPLAGDFFASITINDVTGPYTDTGVYVDSDFIIESYFDDFWPKFLPTGDSCTVFIVVGDNVTIQNLRFDQSGCTPQTGYNYQQIPIICPVAELLIQQIHQLGFGKSTGPAGIGFLGYPGGRTCRCNRGGRSGRRRTIVQNVTSYEYVVAAARAIGKFTVLSEKLNLTCNNWAAAAEECQSLEGLDELYSKDLMPTGTKIVPSSGFLVRVSEDDETQCGNIERGRLVFGAY